MSNGCQLASLPIGRRRPLQAQACVVCLSSGFSSSLFPFHLARSLPTFPFKRNSPLAAASPGARPGRVAQRVQGALPTGAPPPVPATAAATTLPLVGLAHRERRQERRQCGAQRARGLHCGWRAPKSSVEFSACRRFGGRSPAGASLRQLIRRRNLRSSVAIVCAAVAAAAASSLATVHRLPSGHHSARDAASGARDARVQSGRLARAVKRPVGPRAS